MPEVSSSTSGAMVVMSPETLKKFVVTFHHVIVLLDHLRAVNNLCGGVNSWDDNQYPRDPSISGRVRKHNRQPDPGHDRDGVHRLVHPRVLHPPGGRPRQVGLPQGRDEHRGRARHPSLLCHPLLHGPELRDVRYIY